MLRQDDWQRSQLVTFGWLHGKRYGGHLGSCVIMSIIANRVKLGWGSVAEIIHKFPEKAANPLPTYEVPHIWAPDFVRLLSEVENIFDGSKDYAQGATYFCDTAESIADWFQKHILDEKQLHPSVGSMNSLMWFR